jgi:hypothetical protein
LWNGLSLNGAAVMRRHIAFYILALLALPVSLDAMPLGWLVQKSSGKANYQTAQLPLSPLRKGQVVNRGDTVRTGPNGKVLLVRNAESVFIGPYSVASIASPATPSMRTTVLLHKGQVDLTVRTKARPHFSVETPYLVAVVKGTKFKVTASPSRSEVTVFEGRVRVKSLRTGKFVDVDQGQRAVVDRSGALTLTGKGKLASVKSAAPGSSVAASTSTTVSSGTISAGADIGTSGVSAGASVGSGGVSIGAGVGLGGGIQASGDIGLGGLGLGGSVGVGGRQ